LPPAPERILDVGCGTGSLMLLLDEAGYSVVGLDRSSEMLLYRWRGLADRLVLIEGRWDTGAGLTAGQLTSLLAPLVHSFGVEPLSSPALWGRPVRDERYAVVAY